MPVAYGGHSRSSFTSANIKILFSWESEAVSFGRCALNYLWVLHFLS